MKKITIVFLFVSGIVFSQNFHGKATYKTHEKMKITLGSGNSYFQKKIQEQLKKMQQKTYVLNFNTIKSVYREDKALESSTAGSGTFKIMSFGSGSGGTDVLYKNIADKVYKSQKERSGKFFLIEDKIPQVKWELTNETKKIGNYICYKAMSSKEITRKSFLSTDGEQEGTEKKETIITTVWYTPQIPVSNGPELYSGLPGLVLEVNQGNTTIVCVELILNPKEKVMIKESKRGKKVSQKEFDKIMDEHNKELIERFRSKKTKNGKSGGITIEIDN